MTAAQLLNSVEDRGVRLWEEGGALRYSAPKGILDQDVLRRLADNKGELLQILRGRSTAQSASASEIVPDPHNAHQPFPLTDLQAAYLVGRDEAFDIGNIACHAYVEMEKDALDPSRLEAAWRAVIERHAMLRAIILPGGMQKVLREVPPYEIAVLDLRRAEAADIEQRLAQIRESMSHQVFATDVWPLFELRVTLLPGDVARLHIGIDQLIMDGFSLQLLFKELHERYEDPKRAFEPLAVSFRDYVLTEEKLVETPQYQRSREYWASRAATLPATPALPLAKSPESVLRPQFSHRRFHLPADTWAQLGRRAVKAGIPASGAVLAAYADILASWSGNPHFTLNMTLFNRLPLHPNIMEVMGEFTAVNLLEVDNGGRNTFTDRARSINARLWDDLDHRWYGGVRVIRDIAKGMSGSTASVMPVVFTSTIGITPKHDDEAFDLAMFGRVIYYITQTPQVWLDNQTFEQDGMLVCNWDAVEELFPEGMLDEMFAAYEALLHRLASDDGAWTETQRNLLPSAQADARKQVNATAGPVSDELLHTLFMKQAALTPERPAVIAAGKTLSYAELDGFARHIAGRLRAHGAQPNRLVAVVMEKGWEQIAGAMGVLYAGAAYLPIDPSLPKERLWTLLQDGEVAVILTQSRLDASLEWPESLLRLNVDTMRPGNEPEAPAPAQKPEDLAYVIFTSGSTGRPKGVMIGHRGAVNTLLDINDRFGVTAEDRVFALSGLSFDLSVYDIFGPLAVGGAVVVPDADKTKDPAHWLSLVTEHRVTIWDTVPALMQMLAEYGESVGAELPSLRLVLLSGDWIPVDLSGAILRRAPAARVVGLGGATEASIWSVLYPIDHVDPAWKSIPYGRPMRNQQLHVLGRFMEDCPDWTPGQLYIGGIGLADGYWRDKEKTEAAFVTHPSTGERLYRTGDMARYTPGGTLEFLGREDFQVKLGGFRIELGEIEAALKEHPGVRDAVVAVNTDPQGAKHLAAYVVPAAEHGGTLFADDAPPANAGAWRDLLVASRNKAGALPEGVTDGSAFLSFWESLDAVCIAYMCKTLREMGVFAGASETLSADEIVARCGIQPAHRKLLVRWLNLLSREGLMERVGERIYRNPAPLPLQDTEPLWERVAAYEHGIGHKGLLLEYIKRSCGDLAGLFKGELDPHKLLFPDGSWDVAETVYQYNPMSQYYYAIMKAGMRSIVRGRGPGRTLRILEVGAGVGSSTAAVLPELDPEHTLYTYTDISSFFLSEAKEKFKDYPFLEYALFDINTPPERQGYEPHSYDVVIANNVLHNAADMAVTMRRLNSLLDENGCVLILEQTGDNLPLLVTMEFLIDFSELEDDRVKDDSPFLSQEKWNAVLAANGFGKHTTLPVPGHPCGALGQHIILGQSTAKVRRLDQGGLHDFLSMKLPAYMVPARYTALEALPLTPTGKVDRKALASGRSSRAAAQRNHVEPRTRFEKTLAAIWADVLGLERVGVTDDFFELGGDSLLLTKLLTKMREAFGDELDWEELTLRNLFEAPTVTGIAATVERIMEDREARAANGSTDSPLVLMQSGGGKTPFFLISDGRGRLFVYNSLRKHFAPDRPLYGLQVHDIAAYIAAEARIETLAEEYIAAIRTVQPQGPYLLGGFCMGGIIAYEMAQQLREAGQEVALVTLISSMKPPFLIDDDIFIFHMLCKELAIPLERAGLGVDGGEFDAVAKNIGEWTQQSMHEGGWKDRLTGPAGEAFLAKYHKLEAMSSEERLRLAYDLARQAGNPHIGRMTFAEFTGMFSIYRVSVVSVAKYKPRAYDGDILVVKPKERDSIMSQTMDIVALWEGTGLKHMEVVETGGNHVTCLEEPHVAGLAERLESRLEAARPTRELGKATRPAEGNTRAG